MKIVVFVKLVPDSTAEIAVENGQIDWGDAPLVINPWDEIAVEAALLQMETGGSEVVAVSVGKEGETEALKHAMAMGCEEAALVTDPALAGLDSQAAARVMAAAVKKVGDVQAAFFGRQAIDSETGVTAAQTARVLGWPVLSLVSKIIESDPGAGTVTVERSTDEGKQVVKAKLPVVMTFGRDFAEPRYPSFIRKRKAAKAEIPAWGLAELGLIKPGSVVEWRGVEAIPPKEIEVEMIEGSANEVAVKLVDRIMEAKA